MGPNFSNNVKAVVLAAATLVPSSASDNLSNAQEPNSKVATASKEPKDAIKDSIKDPIKDAYVPELNIQEVIKHLLEEVAEEKAAKDQQKIAPTQVGVKRSINKVDVVINGVKRNMSVYNLDITLPKGQLVYLPKIENVGAYSYQDGQVNFDTLNERTLFYTIDDKCNIKGIYLYDAKAHTLQDVSKTDKELEKVAKQRYYSEFLKLDNNREVLKQVGNFITVEKDSNYNISKINITSPNHKEELTRNKDGVYFNSKNQKVSNVRITNSGTISYTVCNEETQGQELIYNVNEKGEFNKYKSANISSDTVAASYTNFGFSKPNSQNEIIRRGRGVSQQDQYNDAMAILKKAQETGLAPVFFNSHHGALNYNVGTGRDSEWLRIIAKAVKDLNFTQPIVIEMMHCNSFLTPQEIQALKEFPVGTLIIKSTINKLSSYNPATTHSGKGRYSKLNTLGSVAHFGANVLAYNNEPTVGIVTQEGVVVFSERGSHPLCSNLRLLPRLNDRKVMNKLEELGVTQEDARYFLRNPHSRFLIQCYLYSILCKESLQNNPSKDAIIDNYLSRKETNGNINDLFASYKS